MNGGAEPGRVFDPATCGTDGVVFVDESKYQASRFGSVAAVTIRRPALRPFIGHWGGARPQGDELKWAGVTDSHRSRAAIDCIKVVEQYVIAGHLRIDVLTWDRQDARFRDVRRPDHLANLVRMLQHLIVNALDKRDDLVTWDYVPVENQGIKWDDTWRPLDFGLTKKRRNGDGAFQSINRPHPSDSAAHPLIQVADLFAGYVAYVAETPSYVDQPPTGSNMERQRAPVIAAMTALVRGVSYARFNGLSTPNETIINFWPYRSQGSYDRVPTRLPRHLANLDAESLSNERCSKNGCVEYVTFGQSIFPDPLCLEHFQDSAAGRDAAEAGHARYEITVVGRFWCEACGFARYTEQTAVPEYDEHRHVYRYYCPVHRSLLGSLLDNDGSAEPIAGEIDKRTRYSDQPHRGG